MRNTLELIAISQNTGMQDPRQQMRLSTTA